MEVGAIAESVTVTGQSPIIETSNASQGTVLDSAALQALPSPGRSAFMIGTTVPTVIPTGDTQFNRQQDQTNASLLSLGGGTRRGNSYTLDGVPITDMRNRAVANPTIEALEDMKVQVHTYDAEMGAHRRRRVQHDAEVGDEQLPWHRLLPDPADFALEEQLLQRQGEPRRSPTTRTTSAASASADRSSRTGRSSGSRARTIPMSQTRNAAEVMPTALERAGDFSRTTNAAGVPVVIYDPLTRQPFPGNVIPGQPHQPGVRRDAEVSAAARFERLQRQRQLQPHVADQVQVDAGIHRQGRAQVHRPGVADRFLSLQPVGRAVRELLRDGRPDRAEPVCRPARLPPEAAAADPRDQQHLGR